MATKRLRRADRLLTCLFNQSQSRPSLSTSHFPICQSRCLHRVPELPHHEHFRTHGVGSGSTSSGSQLLSTGGYKIGWVEYQKVLVNNLNYICDDADRDLQKMHPLPIARSYARDPNRAALFNYASQAHNNHFFFEALAPEQTGNYTKPTRPRSSPTSSDAQSITTSLPNNAKLTSGRHLSDFPRLQKSLEDGFRSIEVLRDQMVLSATGMFGVGYVWLVWSSASLDRSSAGEWRILCTYNAGTPYSLTPRASPTDGGMAGGRGSTRGRQQGVDMNTSNRKFGGVQNSVGSFGPHSEPGRQEADRALGAPAKITPVLCVSTWHQVWLRDWGVAKRREFLDTWWDFIDWSVVANRTPGMATRDVEMSKIMQLSRGI